MDNLNNNDNLEESNKDHNPNIKGHKEKEKTVIQYFPYLLIFAFLLFFSVFGITYSVYKGDLDDNEITTDNILFTYSDVDKAGNGIYLKNAVSISDKQGKMMVGSKQYFDFFVTATAKKSNLIYYILVDKAQTSTLQNENVRVYLTQMMGSHENEIILKNFSDLKIKELNGKKYYILYSRKLQAPFQNHTDSYRLRMWVKHDAKEYQNKNFSVKVDVYAEQVEG